MRNEKIETKPLIAMRDALFAAAKKEDWHMIDETLMPQLPNFNSKVFAGLLLPFTASEDPNIRDVVASALSVLNIADEPMRNAATTAMIKMATTDDFVFPAGRAATYLLKNEEDKKRKEEIAEAIETFKQRAREQNWRIELVGNIPELLPLFPNK